MAASNADLIADLSDFAGKDDMGMRELSARLRTQCSYAGAFDIGYYLGIPYPSVGGLKGPGGKLPWTSWQNYPKVTLGGREYAMIGNRLYTRHAVDRMQPSGLGAPAGAPGRGRSVSPNYIEDVIGRGKPVPVKGPNGEARVSYTSGSVQVITENGIVITVITR